MKLLAQAVNIGEELKLKDTQGVGERFPSVASLGQFISDILPNVYVVTGIIFLFLLIGGGLTVIISAGQSNPENAAKGQKAVSAAVIGFLVIFASYWIIRIIETITGLDIF